jgi:hypothetical protein
VASWSKTLKRLRIGHRRAASKNMASQVAREVLRISSSLLDSTGYNGLCHQGEVEMHCIRLMVNF